MRAFLGLFGAAATAGLLAACSGARPNVEASDEAVTEGEFSYAGQAVLEVLRAKHADMRGRTWDFGDDDTFRSGFVLQTPLAQYWDVPSARLPIATTCDGRDGCDPDFHLYTCDTQRDCDVAGGGLCTAVASTVSTPGQQPRTLCVGHSDAIVDDFYDVVAHTRSFVDVTSLSPPDGRFEAGLRNAITFLSRSGAHVRVRVLYGDIIGGVLIGDGRGTKDVLSSLTRDLDADSHVRVVVGEYRDGVESWDHAKIVSSDGKVVITGSHNMWTKHYLQHDPVHEISMRVEGSAAAQASRYTNELWRYTCHGAGLTGWTSVSDFPSGARGCEEPFAMPPPATRGSGSSRVITVGRLGAIGDESSDDAILALLDAARAHIKLSLQDIGPPGAVGVHIAGWPEPYLRALVSALGRGVDVHLVLTNKGAVPGGLSAGSATYSNGYTPGDVVQKIAEYANAHPELLPNGADVVSLLCSKLHATSLRPSTVDDADSWSSGATFANHAKLVIVDDLAFYLGSQNWYPANLAEFGMIVDDPTAVKELENVYYDKLWSASARVAVSGAGVSRCVLR